jgi:hypothetical protein
MNGPFFSERGIIPYSSTLRSFTHCARRSLRNPRTGPDTRCEIEQNGQTKRVPCAFEMFSTITAQPGRQNRISTCGAGCIFDVRRNIGFATALAAGLAAGFAAWRRAGLPAARRVDRLVDLVLEAVM